MMSCREVAENGSAYLERELSPVRRLSLRLHMMLCHECRGLVQGIRKLLQASPALRTSGDTNRYEDLAAKLTGKPDHSAADDSPPS
jgi:hypothetical protein